MLIMYVMFSSEDRPLNLPLTCDVVDKGGLWAPILRGRGYPRFRTRIFKWHSLPNMWPLLNSTRIRRTRRLADEKEEEEEEDM